MPCHEIERAVVLLNGYELAVRLVDDLPAHMQFIVDGSHWVQKVTRIGHSMATKGSEIWKLPHRAPHLSDVASCYLCIRGEVEAEPDSSLYDANLSWLQKNLSHLSLDVEIALLRADQEVAVSVAECPSFHVGVDHVDIECNALSDVGVAAATQCVQAIRKVDLLVILG